MAKTAYESIDDYIAAQPKEQRPYLEKVRATIKKAVPDAEEVVSYQIAAFKVDGRILIYFAAWKEHWSIYPATAALVKTFKKDLAPYEVNDKGTIRFPYGKVPVKLVERLAKFRAKEVAAAAGKKKAKKK